MNDISGNKEWENGDIVTPDKMNNIEGGLKKCGWHKINTGVLNFNKNSTGGESFRGHSSLNYKLAESDVIWQNDLSLAEIMKYTHFYLQIDLGTAGTFGGEDSYVYTAQNCELGSITLNYKAGDIVGYCIMSSGVSNPNKQAITKQIPLTAISGRYSYIFEILPSGQIYADNDQNTLLDTLLNRLTKHYLEIHHNQQATSSTQSTSGNFSLSVQLNATIELYGLPAPWYPETIPSLQGE